MKRALAAGDPSNSGASGKLEIRCGRWEDDWRPPENS